MCENLRQSRWALQRGGHQCAKIWRWSLARMHRRRMANRDGYQRHHPIPTEPCGPVRHARPVTASPKAANAESFSTWPASSASTLSRRHFSAIGYAAAKGAIISMTKAAAALYAKEKIRINAIAPALVHTPMSARASEDKAILKFIKQKQPLTAVMIPVNDVAASSVFFTNGCIPLHHRRGVGSRCRLEPLLTHS